MAQTASAVDHIGVTPAKRPMRPIDLVHLARQCLGDEGLEQEVLRLFDTTIATYLGRLQQSATPEDIKLNIHSIKGAAAGVGAFGIADIARAAEADIAEGRAIAAEQMADLAMAVEEVRSFIARVLTSELA